MAFSYLRLTGAILAAGFYLAQVPKNWAQSTGILREVYSGISGSAVANLTNAPSFPASPSEAYLESAFEAPANFSDNYGQRMRALVLPPTTGQYVFWISGDDGSALFLSSDENPANKVQIATVNSWTNPREWTKEANQRSAAITLTAGLRYYIEALQKEGEGGDNLAVRWQLPGGAIEEPIPGSRLVPVGLGPPVISAQPTNMSVIEGGSALFSVRLDRNLGATFQWQKGGVNLPDATNSAVAYGPVSLADNGSTFQCLITNPYGSTNSSVVTLTVTPDVTRPALASVGSLSDPQVVAVIFSEPVESASATAAANYTLNNGVSVSSASFGTDTRTIILRTTPMAPQTTYTLVVNNVRDRATTPNSILPDSQRSFSLVSVPLDITFVRPPAEPLGPSSRHGPIIISEIMFHPTNRLDGKNLEFIEVFNSNPFAEDISGYRISGEADFTFPSNTVMAGRSFLVVAPAPADVQSGYGIANVLGGSSNRLSNGSGTLRVRNRQDAILFEVNYDSDPPWPVSADGAGHSLVLARPSLGERNPEAWAASEVAGGSPGATEPSVPNPYRSVVINEFLAHTDLPDLDFVELYNYSTSPVDLSGCSISDDPEAPGFVIPANTMIPAQGFVSFTETQLGFALNAAGETIYLKSPNSTRVIDAVRFIGQENGVSVGRFPDGATGLYRLQAKTPGVGNTLQRPPEVVVNEILYAPLSGDGEDEFIELHNPTGVPVDVGRWRIEDGVQYTIPPGVIIPAKGYLVIAKNAARLMTNYASLNGANAIGDFSGNLSNGGERIALTKPDEIVSTNAALVVVTNTIHIVMDEVTYQIGGRWGRWSHEGGSSLELMDARSDRRLAPNWADSDETAKSGWTTIEFTGVLDNGSGAADSLQVILLGPGECLVDNVEVFAAGGANLITNPSFESSSAGWFFQGNHDGTTIETAEGYNSTRSLHVRAVGRGDTGANRIRTRLSATLNSGQTATLRARVRWLAGNPEILLRLKGNWLEATGNIVTARNLGTPGASNSRARSNSGPAITGVTHAPLLPTASQPVAVVARVHDPDGLAALFLSYRIDPSTNMVLIPMAPNGAGLYSATIPGQTSGALAAFHVQALDNGSPRVATRFPDDAPSRECLVRWGDPVQTGNFGTYRVWMTQATLSRWSTREKLSNKPLDCTFVYGTSRVIYDIGGQYSGSPYHAPGFNSPIGNVCDYVLNFPDDDVLLGETDFTLQWPGNGGGDNTYQREQTAYWIAEQTGLPYCYRRSVNLFVNGVRRAQFFDDAQQPNGDLVDEFYPDGVNGDLHKVALWFEFDDLLTSFSGNGASLSRFTTTGNQKKLARYRWNFQKRAVEGSASNYTNLFALVEAVNVSGLGANYRNQLQAQMDVDVWLKTFAVQHIVGNNDSFAYGGGQNMYIYKPAGDTWKMLIWDIDFAFASAGPTSDVFQGIGRSNGIDLGEPAYRRRYWEILQDLANGPLVATRVNPVLDAKYNAMIASGRTVDSPTGIKNHISQRRTYLLGLINSNSPANFALTLNGGAGFSTNRNLIALTGIAPFGVRSVRVNGSLLPITWTSISNWTALVTLAAGNNALNLQGLDAAGNAVSSASSVININYTGAADQPQDKLVINEIMYNPVVPNASYVEIYNRSVSNAFDLTLWRLAGADFTFPPGTILAPGGYAVIAKDRVTFAVTYGANIPMVGEFSGNLQNNGETLRLVQPGATPAQDLIVDEVRFDSEAPWPGAANGTGASLQLIDASQDNNRVGNWAAVPTNAPPPPPQWRYVATSSTASSSTLYVYLQLAGEVYLDDLKLVSGPAAEAGANLIQNGDFESAFPGPWTVSANHAASVLSTAVKRSGSSSLRLVASSGGTSQSSSIWQVGSPALVSGQTYTLSFWYLENTNGGTLTIRLSSSALRADVNIAPAGGATSSPRFTPGAANSVVATLPTLPPLWLNEIVPLNQNGAMDRFGHRHAWAELYNGGATVVNLGGLFLANNYSNLTQWSFPPGTSVGAGQFLQVWLDGNPGESAPAEIHTSFNIPPSAGSLALVQVSGGRTNVLDYLNYTVNQPDRSYGSSPDGAVSGRQVFYYTTPGGANNPAPPPLTVFINEWMADNTSTLTDPTDNDLEDWFEMYNPSDSPADLTGFYLGTSLTNKTQFLIPNGYVIPPHGYMLVWADSESGQNSTNTPALHTSFKLSKSGEAIGLFASDGTVVDYVAFGPQATDVSEGRFPNGGGGTYPLTTPTPGASNFLVSSNSPPSVGGIPDQIVIEGQLLLLTAAASDSESPPQNLIFSLGLNAPVNAAINPVSGLFSWRPSSAHLGTNLVTVRATDDGAPPMTGVGLMRVVVAPRPKVASITPDANGCAVTFVTVPGKTYRVEYKNSLQEVNWIPLDVDSIAQGETLTVNDNLGLTSQRFYRIVVLD